MLFKIEKIITGHSGSIYGMCKGSQAHTVFTAAGDRFVTEWNLEEGKQEPLAIRLEQPAYAVCYIEKFNYLVLGNGVGGFHIIDLNERKEIRHFTVHTKGIFDFYFREEFDELVVLGGDGMLTVWTLPQFELLRKFELSSAKLRQIAVSKELKTMAVASGDGYIRLFDYKFFTETGHIEAHEMGVSSVAWHPTKPVLFSGGKDAMLNAWNAEKEEYNQILSLPAHNYAIYSIAFHPSGNYLATCSRDKTIKIWDAQSMDVIQRIDMKSGGHTHSINKLLWYGDKLVSCGDDRKIIVWKNED